MAATTVKVVWGAMKISPIQYSNFDTESVEMTTEVLPGETPEQAMQRAYTACERMARAAYPRKLAAFKEMYAQAAQACAAPEGRR
jgi:hypothetical protein